MKLFALQEGSPEWERWQAAVVSFNAAQNKNFSPELLQVLGR